MTEEQKESFLGGAFFLVIMIFAGPPLFKWSWAYMQKTLIKTISERGMGTDLEAFHSRITGQQNPWTSPEPSLTIQRQKENRSGE